MMANFRDMLDRAKCGTLSPDDFAVAMKAIAADEVSHGDLYTALHVVGLAGSPAHAEAVRRYLWSPADPMLSRLALAILCDYWGMASQLLPEIHDFLGGVDWDVDKDVRDIAVPIAGRHLRQVGAPMSLAQLLLHIAEDGTECESTREGALRAMAGGLGDSLTEVSSPAVRVRVGSDQAVDVVARFRERYALQ